MQQVNYAEIIEFDPRLALVAIALHSEFENAMRSKRKIRRATVRIPLTGSVFVRSTSVKLAIGSSKHVDLETLRLNKN
jgi:hypothetical protein